MAAVPDKVLRWLWEAVMTKYQDPNRTYSDVARTLQLYPTLRPRTEVHTSQNGVSALLLQLHGTMPVAFRGAAFNIPVAIWIPRAYPREAPLVYVTPTTEMAIRPGQHVSVEGMVYHPYLANWSSHWDKSNIADFFSMLAQIFMTEPPVASRGPTTLSPQSAHQQNVPASRPPPIPPTPEEWRRSTASSQAIPSGTRLEGPPPFKPPKPGQVDVNAFHRDPAPPARPPKPYEDQPQDQVAWRNSGFAGQRSNASSQPLNQQSRPNAPPLPPLPSSPAPVSHDQTRNQTYNQQPPHVNHQPMYGQFQPVNSQQQYHDPRILQYAQPQGYGGPPPAQYSRQAPNHPQPAQPTPKKPTQDLLSAPLDISPSQANPSASMPVPQVPRNPERDALLHALSTTLRTQLSTEVSQNQAALPALQSQQNALHQAKQNMHAELAQLRQLDAMLSSNEQILHEAMRDADRIKESVGQREVPAVDEVLVAPTVVGEQLYGLVADERSIADAMFLLSRALDKGRIEGDVFVKQTRSLAREQFMRKALVKKIAKGMGLAI